MNYLNSIKKIIKSNCITQKSHQVTHNRLFNFILRRERIIFLNFSYSLSLALYFVYVSEFNKSLLIRYYLEYDLLDFVSLNLSA